jgi:hypothetical protein
MTVATSQTIPNKGLMTPPQDIVAYLLTLPHVTEATPCTVIIRGGHYPAARYVTKTPIDPGTQAYARGERIATNEMIYCAGPIPAVNRRGNVAFRMVMPHKPASEQDARDWFLASYYPAHKGRKPQSPPSPDSEFARYHPFGWNFLLSPWVEVNGVKIDSYARVPYNRYDMTVTDVVSTTQDIPNGWREVEA